MSYSIENKLVIGISSRALFDLNTEHGIFEKYGLEAYLKYQTAHEREPMKPGPGFGLVKALLGLNECADGKEPVEIIIMSHNSPDMSLRIFHTIEHYGLKISRAVLAGGVSLMPYLEAMHVDLFLSTNEEDVQRAIDGGFAAGIIDPASCAENNVLYPFGKEEQMRIAFDADAVLFSDESERIFQQGGLKAFEENECRNADIPLEPGPFAVFLKKLSELKKSDRIINDRIRTALVTSRCAPAHERVIRTLRHWDVQMDEAFFLGGLSKKEILKAFGAQIFFDDQPVHLTSAAKVVPVARVPYRYVQQKVRLI